MSDTNKDWAEFKRELIETRNQAIKTDNQVKNLALDVKGFENRFESLERRTRMASLGVHVIVALTIAGSAFVISSIRTASLRDQIKKATVEAVEITEVAEAKTAEADAKIQGVKRDQKRRAVAQKLASSIVKHLAGRRDKEAVSVLFDLNTDDLSKLESSLLEETLGDLRTRSGEASFKAGKGLLTGGKEKAAIVELERSIKVHPTGRNADSARYLLGTTLYERKEYDRAVEVLQDLRGRARDKALKDELDFYLGTGMARLGKHEQARKVLKTLAAGRYASSARTYLAALDAGTALPAEKP